MHLKRTVDPVAEPITWAECMAHLRLDDETEKNYIESLIVAAREYAEQATGRALMTQTWELKLDRFPPVIVVPFPPLQSATISYVDTNGTTQTLGTGVYTVNTSAEPGRIYEAYNQTWPSVRDQEDAVTVTYVAGYTSASAVPQTIKQAMMILVTHWFAVREPIITGTIVADTPMSVQSLLGMNNHGWQF